MKKHHQKFIKGYLGTTMVIVVCVMMFNVMVDPYDAYPAVHLSTFTAYKDTGSCRSKAELAQRQTWRTLILGSSLAVVGMDATHATLKDHDAFNLGLNGVTLPAINGALHYALEQGHPIKRVVLIFDQHWLLRVKSISSDYQQSPLNADYSLVDYHASNWFGAQTMELSSKVIKNWQQAGPAPYDAFGRRVRPVFKPGTPQHKQFEKVLPAIDSPENSLQTNLARFEKLAMLCLSKGIRLQVVLPPYHVSVFVAYREHGHWQNWEKGKLALMKTIDQLNQQFTNQPAIELWDFGQINGYTTEPIPPAGDTTHYMKWFWDPVHFRKVLGDKIIDQLFRTTQNEKMGTDVLGVPGIPGVQGVPGVRLSHENIHEQLAELRSAFECFVDEQARPLSR